MAVQTTVTLNPGTAYDGLIADMNPHTLVSKKVETAAGIAFGRVVSLGTAADQVDLGGDGTGFGVTVRTLDREGAQTTGAVQYDQYDVAAVMVEGYCYAAIYTASASAGDKLKYDDTTGQIEAGTAGAGETQMNAYLQEAVTSSGQIALIRLDSPMAAAEEFAAREATVDAALEAADDLKVDYMQATAASETIRLAIANRTGLIRGVKAQAGAGAGSGESLTVDVKINGTSCLTGVITLDAAAGTTVQDGTIDVAADDLAEDDIITVVFAYTAGTPTPIVNTLVSVVYD